MARVDEATHVGLVRKVNEDSSAVLGTSTYVLADGMGGHAAGEIASQLLVRTVRECLQASASGYSELVLKKAILLANEKILAESKAAPQYMGMGTTATIFHQEERQGFWAHVGDSRLYLFRQGNLQQVTRDHSLVEDLVESGSITREEARNHPRKNVITRAVGVEEILQVDTGRITVEEKDMFLLCSDGLTNMVEDEEIRQVLGDENCANWAQALVQKALSAGGLDNITVIVVACDA